MAIGGIENAKNGLRPLGDRPVEFVFSFVCNKSRTPGVGYVEENGI